MALRGAPEPGAGAWRGGGVGAPPFAGSGLFAGRVGPVRRHRWGLGGLTWWRLLLGGGEVPHPPWICRVGVWRRVRWVRRLWRQVVRVQWLFRGLSRVGVGPGGALRRGGGRGGGIPGRTWGSGVERPVGGAAIRMRWCCSCRGGCGQVG